MEKSRGNAIAQYGIIIALIALAIIPTFILLGGTIVNEFTKFYNGLGGSTIAEGNPSNPAGPTGPTGPTNPTDPTGPTEPSTGHKDPEVSCSGGNCSLDFGDFVLEGLPEDMGDFIESTSSSGETALFADIMEQIAEQMPESPEKDLLTQLANAGHEIAYKEGDLENIYNWYDNETAYMPDDIGDRTEALLTKKEAFESLLAQFNGYSTTTTSSTSKPFLKDPTLEPNPYDDLEALATDPAVAKNIGLIRKIVNDLAQDITSMAQEAYDCTSNWSKGTGMYGQTKALNVSDPTHYESSAICSSGGKNDNGVKCGG